MKSRRLRNAIGEVIRFPKKHHRHAALDPWNRSARRLLLDLALNSHLITVDPHGDQGRSAGRPLLRVGSLVEVVRQERERYAASHKANPDVPDVSGGDDEVSDIVREARRKLAGRQKRRSRQALRASPDQAQNAARFQAVTEAKQSRREAQALARSLGQNPYLL